MLRMLRGTEAGGHSPLTRLIALVVVVALLGLSVPVLIPVFRWLLDLL